MLRLLASRMGDPIADRLRSTAMAEQITAERWIELREAIRERMLIAGS
ncbi:MAG: hypothetical protein QM831_36125 [Kofleriaceae bacterium]